MEKSHAALVEDLADRGLLDQTLVINTGEFGRTPKVNGGGGRDHWPSLCNCARGGGIKGGQVMEPATVTAAGLQISPCHPQTCWQRVALPRHRSRGRVARSAQPALCPDDRTASGRAFRLAGIEK